MNHPNGVHMRQGRNGEIRQAPTTNDEMVSQMQMDGILTDLSCAQAFRAVDRMIFAPDSEKTAAAYAPMPLREQTIHLSAPPIYAEALERLLPITPGMSFLNIGSGTGYFNSIVAHLLYAEPYISTNHGIEIWPQTIEYCREKVKQIPKADETCDFFQGNVYSLDVKNSMKYDRIYVGACASSRSKYLYELLEIGGILVGPFQTSTGAQQLRKVTRVSQREFRTELLKSVSFANLVSPEIGVEKISYSLPEKPWSETHHRTYPQSFRTSIVTTLMSIENCKDDVVPPKEIWTQHIFKWCRRHWFDVEKPERVARRARSTKATDSTCASPAEKKRKMPTDEDLDTDPTAAGAGTGTSGASSSNCSSRCSFNVGELPLTPADTSGIPSESSMNERPPRTPPQVNERRSTDLLPTPPPPARNSNDNVPLTVIVDSDGHFSASSSSSSSSSLGDTERTILPSSSSVTTLIPLSTSSSSSSGSPAPGSSNDKHSSNNRTSDNHTIILGNRCSSSGERRVGPYRDSGSAGSSSAGSGGIQVGTDVTMGVGTRTLSSDSPSSNSSFESSLSCNVNPSGGEGHAAPAVRSAVRRTAAAISSSATLNAHHHRHNVPLNNNNGSNSIRHTGSGHPSGSSPSNRRSLRGTPGGAPHASASSSRHAHNNNHGDSSASQSAHAPASSSSSGSAASSMNNTSSSHARAAHHQKPSEERGEARRRFNMEGERGGLFGFEDNDFCDSDASIIDVEVCPPSMSGLHARRCVVASSPDNGFVSLPESASEGSAGSCEAPHTCGVEDRINEAGALTVNARDANESETEDEEGIVEVFEDGRRHTIGQSEDPDDATPLNPRAVNLGPGFHMEMVHFLAFAARERQMGLQYGAGGGALEMNPDDMSDVEEEENDNEDILGGAADLMEMLARHTRDVNEELGPNVYGGDENARDMDEENTPEFVRGLQALQALPGPVPEEAPLEEQAAAQEGRILPEAGPEEVDDVLMNDENTDVGNHNDVRRFHNAGDLPGENASPHPPLLNTLIGPGLEDHTVPYVEQVPQDGDHGPMDLVLEDV